MFCMISKLEIKGNDHCPLHRKALEAHCNGTDWLKQRSNCHTGCASAVC